MNLFDLDTSALPVPHKGHPIFESGADIENAKAAMILVHGRGATAQSILELAREFEVNDVIFIAPQAEQNTWYPYRFLAPIEDNEPGISSGLSIIDLIFEHLLQKGFTEDKIFLLGFSQGACLTLEYAARNPRNYGGVFGLSGALIGPLGSERNYDSTFNNINVFLGCSDFDFHIPIEYVNETAKIFKQLGANVEKRIYEGMGHTVNSDEIKFINKSLRKVLEQKG